MSEDPADRSDEVGDLYRRVADVSREVRGLSGGVGDPFEDIPQVSGGTRDLSGDAVQVSLHVVAPSEDVAHVFAVVDDACGGVTDSF